MGARPAETLNYLITPIMIGWSTAPFKQPPLIHPAISPDIPVGLVSPTPCRAGEPHPPSTYWHHNVAACSCRTMVPVACPVDTGVYPPVQLGPASPQHISAWFVVINERTLKALAESAAAL